MSVGSKTDLNFWISWNTVRGRDCAGSNFRSGSTWRSGELFSKGKDRKITAEELKAFTGVTGRTNQEGRDAALLAWEYAGLPIKMRPIKFVKTFQVLTL